MVIAVGISAAILLASQVQIGWPKRDYDVNDFDVTPDWRHIR